MGPDEERRAWLALTSVEGVGEETLGRLLARFGDARAVLGEAAAGGLRRWSAGRSPDEGQRALPAKVIRAIEDVARDPHPRLRRIDEMGLWAVTPLDSDYPPRLRDLDPPPSVLFGWGDVAALASERAVAVVGTRRPTVMGRALAARLCARLVECDATVVSGLAIGIDGAAHAATVDRGGRTVAVLGAGHGQPGPRAHRSLRERIVATGGAVVSEHHPDIQARRGSFPRRNRIIAALCQTVLVIEAPVRSGALITARHGLELGRQVLVAPGRVGDWAVAGSHALLRDTPARPLVGADEMIADLGYFGPSAGGVAHGEPPGSRAPALAMLGVTERLVAERVCRSPAGLDALVADTGLPPAAVSGAVTLLLMRGWLQPVGPAYLPAGPLLG
jgi:DNA processing protein